MDGFIHGKEKGRETHKINEVKPFTFSFPFINPSTNPSAKLHPKKRELCEFHINVNTA